MKYYVLICEHFFFPQRSFTSVEKSEMSLYEEKISSGCLIPKLKKAKNVELKFCYA